eukprot:5381953-Pyramimonas_sp.AAC.1
MRVSSTKRPTLLEGKERTSGLARLSFFTTALSDLPGPRAPRAAPAPPCTAASAAGPPCAATGTHARCTATPTPADNMRKGPRTAQRREGDPGRGGQQGTRPHAGQLGGPASRSLDRSTLPACEFAPYAREFAPSAREFAPSAN